MKRGTITKIRQRNRKIQITVTILLVLTLLPSVVFAAVQTAEVLPLPSLVIGQITYSNNNTGIPGVSVNLTNTTTMTVIHSTTTNDTGYYNFTIGEPGDYYINASKAWFWDNSTYVKVIASETATANLTLWLIGDLNNDGKPAGAGDMTLMNRAVLWEIPGDWRYDLNENGRIADAGDLVLMNRAVLGEIVLT